MGNFSSPSSLTSSSSEGELNEEESENEEKNLFSVNHLYSASSQYYRDLPEAVLLFFEKNQKIEQPILQDIKTTGSTTSDSI